MAKYCSKCGNSLNEGVKFCPKCGAQVLENTSTFMESSVVIEKREIVLAIIFSLLTCGIYGIYWFIRMTDDAKALSSEDNANGVLAFVYTLLTCGIYQIYWYYKMGKNMQIAGELHGITIEDNSIAYLLLGVFGLGLVSYCLIQNDLNKFASN